MDHDNLTVIRLIFISVLGLFVITASGQNLDVPYVPTPPEVVEKMLEVTGVGPGDYVIDLGSGDGRIVIAAALRGAVGHGIDLDPRRVVEATNNALKSGVANKVFFIEGDLFDADISKATVITMYLLTSVNLKLKPILLEKMRPGSRIVSHSFAMGQWEPDEHIRLDHRHIYYWIIPANVKGNWSWNLENLPFEMNVVQEFQNITIDVKSSDKSLRVNDVLLKGERINFVVTDPASGISYLFNGRVKQNSISGTAQVRSGNNRSLIEWSASRR